MDDMNNFLFFASIVSLSFDDWFIREVSMEAKEYNSKITQKIIYKSNTIDLQSLQFQNPDYETKKCYLEG